MAILKRFLPSSHILIKSGITLALLPVLALIGFLIARRGPDMILSGIIALLALVLWMRLGRMEYGILAILLTSGFIRFRLSTGTQSEIVASLVVSLVIVGLWVVQSAVVERRFRLKPAPTNKPLLGFMALCIVSYAWSNMFRDPMVQTWGSFPLVQLAALVVLLLLPAVFLVTSNVVEDTRWLRWISWIIIIIGTLAVLVYELVWQFRVLPSNHPLNSLFQTHGLFAMWVATMAYALVLFDERLPLWLRGALLVLVAAWVHWRLVIGESWVSGWAPMGLACAIVTFLRSKKLFVVLSIAALLYLFVSTNFVDRVFADAESSGSYERLDIWQVNMQHILKHPMFGSGPAGYAVYYMTYNPRNARSTHNNLFDIVAQTGVTGLVCFIWFFAALGFMGNSLCRKLRRRRDFEEAFAVATFAGCIGAFGSMMLGDWIIPFAYNQTITGFDHSVYTWILLGGMVSLYHIVRVREKDDIASGTGGQGQYGKREKC
jgi:O-antigen ligase